MSRLPTRALIFAFGSFVLAVYSVIASLALGFAAIGMGSILALSPDVPFIVGATVGSIGLVAAVFGMALSILQAIAGLGILRQRNAGWGLGLGMSVLAIASGFAGASWMLVWGVFGVWALWTSRDAFYDRR